MESHGLEDMHPKPLTTPKRYGAGMAHTVVSIGFIDYCRLSCTACRITVDYWYGRSWAIMDYCGFWTIMVLSLILDYHCNIVDSGLSWYIMDYRGLWTIMDYFGLSSIIVSSLNFIGVSWMMDYRGLAWAIVDYCASLWNIKIIVDYGLSWFTWFL